jgi:hypothetical protein
MTFNEVDGTVVPSTFLPAGDCISQKEIRPPRTSSTGQAKIGFVPAFESRYT